MRGAVWSPLRLDVLEPGGPRGLALHLYSYVLLPAATRSDGWTVSISFDRMACELRAKGIPCTKQQAQRAVEALARLGLVDSKPDAVCNKTGRITLCNMDTYVAMPDVSHTQTGRSRARGAMKTVLEERRGEEEGAALPLSGSADKPPRQPPPAHALAARRILQGMKEALEMGAGSISGATQGRLSRMLKEVRDLPEAEKKVQALADELVALQKAGGTPDAISCLLRQAPARLVAPATSGGNGHSGNGKPAGITTREDGRLMFAGKPLPRDEAEAFGSCLPQPIWDYLKTRWR